MENIVFTDSEGNKLDYNVLFTFDMNAKSYMVYTDSQLDIDTEINVYYASYKNGDLSKLEPVDDEQDIKILDDMVADFEKTLKENM